jgi:putative FmdB family regulatory protein
MTYEYVCTACGHAWEAEQPISAAPLKDCPHCGQACAKRQISGGQGFILKGGGWYADGYGSKSSKDSESKSESKGESKGEPKKDPKTEPKKDGSAEPKQESPKNDAKNPAPAPSPPKSDGGSGGGTKAEGSPTTPA